jgi:hypothetical protein
VKILRNKYKFHEYNNLGPREYRKNWREHVDKCSSDGIAKMISSNQQEKEFLLLDYNEYSDIVSVSEIHVYRNVISLLFCIIDETGLTKMYRSLSGLCICILQYFLGISLNSLCSSYLRYWNDRNR